MTCGTCLDFYGLKSSLSVGQITNMYEIVEKILRKESHPAIRFSLRMMETPES